MTNKKEYKSKYVNQRKKTQEEKLFGNQKIRQIPIKLKQEKIQRS